MEPNNRVIFGTFGIVLAALIACFTLPKIAKKNFKSKEIFEHETK